MKLIEIQDGPAVSALSLEDLELVSGCGEDGGVPPPACECHTDRSGNLVCKDANGRKC